MYGSCHDITPERCLTTTIKGFAMVLPSLLEFVNATLTLGGIKVESCHTKNKTIDLNNEKHIICALNYW